MKLIDLTMAIDERTPVFPGDPKQEIRQFATIEQNGWNKKRLTFNSHFGTLETFVGEAGVIDVHGQRLIDEPYSVHKTPFKHDILIVENLVKSGKSRYAAENKGRKTNRRRSRHTPLRHAGLLRECLKLPASLPAGFLRNALNNSN